MLGFTGTAQIEDEYFQDVIYRYSLRQAIEDHIVKNIDYVKEDESKNDYEKFQKIYQNHRDNIDRYPLVKPISIIVTRDISHAKNLYDDFISFLASYERKEKKEVESKVLIVTSAREHKINLTKLKYVDISSATTSSYLVEREITKNDIRARILIIPQVVKNELSTTDEKFNVVFNGLEKQLNIDKTRRYFGGVTDFYKNFGLLTNDGVFISKKAKWRIDGNKIIVDLIQE